MRDSDCVRLIDVAREAGVSRAVAGKVLNGGKGNSRVSLDTALRIREVAKRLNYQPNPAAQQLKGMSTRTFGTLVASAGDPLRSFLVQHLDTEAVRAGYHTVIGNTSTEGAEGPSQLSYYVEELSRRSVDGVFCAVHDWVECKCNRKLLMDRHPCTVFYEDPGIAGANIVKANRYIAARLATRHLLERGRRRIGLILSESKKVSSQDRLRGYRDEQMAYGRLVDEELVFFANDSGGEYVFHDPDTLTWRFSEDVVDKAVDRLVHGQGVDALVCSDDFLAASLLRKLRARGISVPGHIAVIGYLNHYLTDWTDPPLTTIDTRQDIAAIQMLKMMERRIESGAIPEEDRIVEVTPKLIVRGSS